MRLSVVTPLLLTAALFGSACEAHASLASGSLDMPTHHKIMDNDEEMIASSCSVNDVCPKSSMAWASGSFTTAGVLTPAAFLSSESSSSLELQISLCCRYLFRGLMLREADLYEHFLTELLHATPFRVLPSAAKLAMFPRESARIVGTRGGASNRRTFTSKSLPSEDDEAFLHLTVKDEYGDGDVLILSTAAIGDDIFLVPFSASVTVHDVQLALSNRVLKCKCPHTLLVMPLLHYAHDTLPTFQIVGGGARCEPAIEFDAAMMTGSSIGSSGVGATSWPTVMRRVGTDVSLPPFSIVHWEVMMIEGDASSLAVPLREHLALASADKGGAGARITASKTRWILPERQKHHHQEGKGSEEDDALSFEFSAHVHVTYQIRLMVTRGRVSRQASANAVLRAPISFRHNVLDLLPPSRQAMPFFGFTYPLQLLSNVSRDVAHRALGTGFYTMHWSVNRGASTRFAADAAHSIVAVRLERGRTHLTALVVDRDAVCPAVIIEKRSVFAIQPAIVRPSTSPTTVCVDSVNLSAREEEDDDVSLIQQLRQGMLQSAAAAVNIVNRSWICQQGLTTSSSIVLSHACTISSKERLNGQGASPTHAVLHIPEARTLALVQWAWTFEVLGWPSTSTEEKRDDLLLDETYASLTTSSTSSSVVIVVRSKSVVIHRRLASIVSTVNITVATSAMQFTAAPPRSDLRGTWRLHPSAPLRQISAVNYQGPARFDSSRAPVIPQSLPTGTLQFLVNDQGELVKMPSLITAGIMTESSFLSRCPDAAVEYHIDMIALPPPAVVPDEEMVYTEDASLELSPPRPAAKDEATTWNISCVEEKGTPHTMIQHGGQDTLSSARITGLHPFRPCTAHWTITNAHSATSKAFHVRRCEIPPRPIFITEEQKHEVQLVVVQTTEDDGGNLSPSLIVPFAGHATPLTVRYRTQSRHATFRTFVREENQQADSSRITIVSANHSDDEFWARVFPAPASPFLDDTVRTPLTSFIAQDTILRDDGMRSRLLTEEGSSSWSVHLRTVTALCSETSVHPNYTDCLAFEARSLCGPRDIVVQVLQVTPITLVPPTRYDAETLLPVIELCEDRITLPAPHAALHTVLGYSMEWTCPSDAPFTIQSSSFSMAQEIEFDASQTRSGNTQAVCTLTVRNAHSHSASSQQYLIQRVFPTVLTTVVTVLSENEVNTTSSPSNIRFGSSPYSPATGSSTTGKVIRFVGSSVVLHAAEEEVSSRLSPLLEAAAEKAQWTAIAVTPSSLADAASFQGTRVLLDAIHSARIPHTAERQAGVTSSVSGFTVPGVYTLVLRQPDPLHPLSCPPVASSQVVQVYRAQVVRSDLVICDSAAVLEAVPLPVELNHQFYGQWEVVSRQVNDEEVLVTGTDFAGIRFDFGQRPRTTIRGLSYGITTVRWAIYKTVRSGNKTDSSSAVSRVVVDEATVRIFVLTENLPRDRLVTLADTVDFEASSSTVQWRFERRLQSEEARPGLFGSKRSQSITIRPVDGHTSNNATGLHASIIHVDRLRVGVTRLLYDVRPSLRQHRFTLLVDKVCPFTPPTRLFEIERVTAYLSVRNVSGVHECDAYRGNVHVTLCLEAGGVGASPSSSSAAAAAPHLAERISLVDAPDVERIVKTGTLQYARTTGCSAPWWATDAASWTSCVTIEDRRCLAITAVATRQLEPLEAAQSFFEAVSTTTYRQTRGGRAASSVCPQGADFISSMIIEGAETWTAASQPSSAGIEAMSDDEAASLPRFLPIRSVGTLKAIDHAGLAPLLGWSSGFDFTASESQLYASSPLGDLLFEDDTTSHNSSSGSSHSNISGAFVVLQLDSTSSYSRLSPEFQLEKNMTAGFLSRCVTQTLRGSDILNTWAPLLHSGDPDNDDVVSAWSKYVDDVADTGILCEPLFGSVERFLPTPHDTPETLRARRSDRISIHRLELVSLTVLEEQLEALNRSHHWTRDGIEITGLSGELRSALNRRRVTNSQLQELLRLRRRDASQQQRSSETAANKDQTKKGETTATAVVPSPSTRWASQKSEVDHMLVSATDATLSGYRLRVLRALDKYRQWTGLGISALRLRLPVSRRFSSPRDFAVRMMVPVETLCDLRPSTSATLSEDGVLFQRLVIKDAAPAIKFSPSAIKQCDIEAAIPPITIYTRNMNFVESLGNVTVAEQQLRVTLSEVSVPPSHRDSESDRIGLHHCLAHMTRGLKWKLDPMTLKTLTVHISPCPSFQMLSPEEYNEQQDSEALLERLQRPRLLRVQIRQVLAGDSFTPRQADVDIVLRVTPTVVRASLRQANNNQGDAANHVALFDARFAAQSIAPPVVCEQPLREKGLELGLELLGDTWDDGVGASVLRSQLQHNSHPTAQDTAMLNSFSLVEHYRLDRGSYSFLSVGSSWYRSAFLQYLSSFVNDAKHVTRYNHSFVSVRIPSSAFSSTSSDYGGLVSSSSVGRENQVPDVLAFPSIEEILYAVPGIATKCEGCLLADKTFLVAGDASGRWVLPPTAAPGATQAPLTAPLVIPMASTEEVPLQWQYQWLCSGHSAARAIERLARASSVPVSSMFFVTELHTHVARDLLGRPLAPDHRLKRLLQSRAVPFQRSQSTEGIAFVMPDEDVESAVSTVLAGNPFRSTAAAATGGKSSVFDYVRDDKYGNSKLGVNATVVLKICSSSHQCTTAHYHPALLLLEPLTGGSNTGGTLGSLGLNTIPSILHHIITVCLALASVTSGRQRREPTMAEIALVSLLVFIAVVALSAFAPMLWIAIWIGLWALQLHAAQTLGAVLLFGFHGLLYALM